MTLTILAGVLTVLGILLPVIIESQRRRKRTEADGENDKIIGAGTSDDISVRLSQLYDKAKNRRRPRL